MPKKKAVRKGLPKRTPLGELQNINATIIEPLESMKKSESKAKATEETKLQSYIEQGDIVSPPYDPFELAILPEYSTVLGPLIETLEVNIDGFGHRFESVIDERQLASFGDDAEIIAAEIKKERRMLENFFNNCCLDDSLVSVRRKKRKDQESTGGAYLEIIRKKNLNDLDRFNLIPSYQMRLASLDKKSTEADMNIVEIDEDGFLSIQKRTVQKRFRRFVQISRAGQKLVWFKEFGDPRDLNCETGDYGTEEKPVPKDKKATEIAFFSIYSPRTPYGVPRYIGNLITIYGDRAADEINYTTLDNNNIPSLVIFCSNGQLTDGSIRRLRKFISLQGRKSRNYSRVLLLESLPTTDEGGAGSQAKLDMKPMVNEQMKDQLFQEYSKNNMAKLRGAFRVPPIFIGSADLYNKNTAETSRRLADEQIFSPERQEFDHWVNRKIMPELGAKYHRFVSNSPNVTDDSDLIQVLTAAEKTGGMTPRIAHMILADIFNKDLPAIDPDKLDPDIPFSIQLAEHAKNTAFMETGLMEPGSQITALKSIDEAEQFLNLKNMIQEELRKRA